MLVVDQYGDALDLAKLLLSLVEAIAVPELGALGQGALVVARRLVGADDDLLDALGGQLVAELSNGEGTFCVLCTGHRHYFVVEQLVGDVHACGDACLHSQLTGVEEGAVADVLEQVRHVGERCLPDPLAALAAHLRQAGDSAVLTAGHGDECVATDSAAADGTLGDSGGTVVGAPTAEVRGSLGGEHVQ
ncbi:hypothetical protein B0E55_06400 [Rhodococcus sp. 66b]|nr:hypothetical protein B0E55_06400 [Rhodococcus sp. 66b]